MFNAGRVSRSLFRNRNNNKDEVECLLPVSNFLRFRTRSRKSPYGVFSARPSEHYERTTAVRSQSRHCILIRVLNTRYFYNTTRIRINYVTFEIGEMIFGILGIKQYC